MSHVSHKNDTLLPTLIGHVTHMNGSCHTHEWVMSQIWTNRVAYVLQHYADPYTCTNTTATHATATHCNTLQIHTHIHIHLQHLQLRHTATLCRSIYMYTYNCNTLQHCADPYTCTHSISTHNCHTLQHYADLYPLLIGLFLCIYGTFWICGSLLFTNFQIYRCDTIQITWITNVNWIISHLYMWKETYKRDLYIQKVPHM